MPGIVKQQPTCRSCGAVAKPLRRCPRCGKRNFAALLGSLGAKH